MALASSATWVIQLEGKPFKVEVYNIASNGRRIILVNDQIVYQGQKLLFDFGGDYAFTVENHALSVNIRSPMPILPVSYELFVDGQSQGEQKTHVPKWTWLFVIPLIVTIPFWAGGGYIPALISGFIAALGFRLAFVFATKPDGKPAFKFIQGFVVSILFAVFAVALKYILVYFSAP